MTGSHPALDQQRAPRRQRQPHLAGHGLDAYLETRYTAIAMGPSA